MASWPQKMLPSLIHLGGLGSCECEGLLRCTIYKRDDRQGLSMYTFNADAQKCGKLRAATSMVSRAR